jgi:hypothetical protein
VKGSGLVAASRKVLEEHHASLKNTWEITTVEEVAVPDAPLSTLIEKLTSHVQ